MQQLRLQRVGSGRDVNNLLFYTAKWIFSAYIYDVWWGSRVRCYSTMDVFGAHVLLFLLLKEKKLLNLLKI